MIYKIVVDKQPSTNPSEDKREYTLNIDELLTNGHVSDNLVITFEEDYVERWLALDEYGKIYELLTPTIEPLDDIDIKLFAGDNYIYVASETGEHIYAQYLLHNEFNEAFMTRKETKSAIKQSADSIELSVGSEIERLDGEIEEVNGELELKVGVNDNDQIVTMLNASASEINLNGGSSINLNTPGKLVISAGNFQLDSQGKMTATGGDIAGFGISSDKLTTHISHIRSGYTQADVTRAASISVKSITPTQEDYDKYDINGDGRIDAQDLSLIIAIVNAGGSLDFNGDFTLKTDNDLEILKIVDKTPYRGTSLDRVTTNIGLLKSSLNNLYIENQLEFGAKYEDSFLDLDKQKLELTHYLPNSHANDSNAILRNSVDDLTGKCIAEFSLSSQNASDKWGNIQMLGCTDSNSEIDQTKIGNPVANFSYENNLTQIIPGKINIYEGSTYCYVDSSGVHTSSLAELKEGFEKYENALETIKNIDIYKYKFKDENCSKKHIGFVIGKDFKYSQELTDDDNRTVELYSFISVCCKAIQEQQEEIEKLKKQIGGKNE